MAIRYGRGYVKQTTTGFRDLRHHICQKQIPIPNFQRLMMSYPLTHTLLDASVKQEYHSGVKKINLNKEEDNETFLFIDRTISLSGAI